jgi:hypothetical protein
MTNCAVTPGCKGEAKWSLPLSREKKDSPWVVTPVCSACRKALERAVRAAGKELIFFGLEGSVRQAEKRNAQIFTFQPFLAKFAKAKVKAKPETAKPDLKLVANR